jgi:hypothetical protein
MKFDLYALVLGMIRRRTLVLATFGSDFVLHLNMNRTPHFLL